MAHEITYEGLRYACVHTIHRHMVAVVGGPSERQLRQITCADDQPVFRIGQIHQYLRAFACLRVFVNYVVIAFLVPDVVKVALDCESFGADGITVHPRPDERHIRRSDVYDLRPLLRTEFNIEGYPSPEFIDLVLKVKPHQVTLVPDEPSQITSNAGWDTKANLEFLTEVLDQFDSAGIRTSVFVAADPEMVEYAAKAGADRVELYTEPYATGYPKNPEAAIAPFIEAAKTARKLGIGLNAGHDLSLVNLK